MSEAATTVTAPSAMQAIGTFRRMTWTRIRRGRLRFVALALLAMPVIGTALLALTGKWGRDLFDNVLQIHLRFLVLFLPALATSSIVGEEIESRTFTFVFARPSPRWAMVIGKYVATVVPLIALFAISVTLSFVIALLVPPAGPRELIENLPTLGRSLAATTLAVIVFAAMCALIGSWFTRHPFIAVMGYLLLIEGLLGSLHIIINVLSMSWHVRRVAGIAIAAGEPGDLFAELLIPAPVSAIVLIIMALLTLVLAAWSVSGAEYRTDR